VRETALRVAGGASNSKELRQKLWCKEACATTGRGGGAQCEKSYEIFRKMKEKVKKFSLQC
jgi:hypothetical protein